MRALVLLGLTFSMGCGDDVRKAPRDSAIDSKLIDGATVDTVMIDGSLVDASPDGPPADAGPDATMADAAPDAFQAVVTVTCANTEPVISTTDGVFSYSGSPVTIAQNTAVKFVMSATHNVVPNTTGSDPGLVVGFATTKCLKFTTTGTFGFHCGPHSFTGSVTVN
jgi:plastocyanin